MLGVLNSKLVAWILDLLNPSVNFQGGDIERIPLPDNINQTITDHVVRALSLAKEDSAESETTYDFVAPPAWQGLNHRDTEAQRPEDTEQNSESLCLCASVVQKTPAQRHTELAAIEREIDEEVYRLYGIAGEDRAAIEAELNHRDTEAQSLEDEDEPNRSEDDESESLSLSASVVDDPAALARRWLSYALGVALGRFKPGVAGTIGCGRFAPELAAQLRALADEDGLGLIEPNHPDDLVARIERTLELMVGEEAASHLISAATGGKALAAYLTGEFYKEHTRQYRKRPVYWLLQSPRRSFSLLLFHERLTADSLPLILGNRYLQGRVNALRGRLGELQAQGAAAAPGRDRKAVERERDEVADRLTDAEELVRLVREVIERTSERGAVVGWQPDIDDGVLINLAPLHTLMPAWAAEPKKCWQAIERGDYDWSHTARRYWPERVLAKCRTNKSYAIAHGVDGTI